MVGCPFSNEKTWGEKRNGFSPVHFLVGCNVLLAIRSLIQGSCICTGVHHLAICFGWAPDMHCLLLPPRGLIKHLRQTTKLPLADVNLPNLIFGLEWMKPTWSWMKHTTRTHEFCEELKAGHVWGIITLATLMHIRPGFHWTVLERISSKQKSA